VIAAYLTGLGLPTGWLVIFDRRSDQPPIADRTSFERATTPSARAVMRSAPDVVRDSPSIGGSSV